LLPAPTGESGFPSTVTAARQRSWAAFSTPVQTGPFSGKAGVIFQPSRMAGDSYKLKAYFDAHSELDVASGQPPAALHAETGTFQVWRRVEVQKILKKRSEVVDFNVDEVKGYYAKAYLELDASPVHSVTVFDQASYEAHFPLAYER